MVDKGKLWIFGDSTSRNHGLLPEDSHYRSTVNRTPYFTDNLKDYFNLQEIKNYAIHGASNEDILFTFLSKSADIQEQDLVLLQKTHPTRLNFYDRNNAYLPCHYAINANSINFNISDKYTVDSIKNYIKNYVVNNTDNFENREIVRFYNTKKLISKLKIKCILWDSSILDGINGLTTITTESLGKVKDEHIGFRSQKILSDFLIKSFENKIEFPYYFYNLKTLGDISNAIIQEDTPTGLINHMTYKVIR